MKGLAPTLAVDLFEGAYRLKAKNPDMFLQWIRLETAEKEWSNAIAVADRAAKVLSENDEKCYAILERKVFALRQAGFDLHAGLHREKAERMWTDACEEIERTLKSPEFLPEGGRQLNASMYYTIVVCLDMLDKFLTNETAGSTSGKRNTRRPTGGSPERIPQPQAQKPPSRQILTKMRSEVQRVISRGFRDDPNRTHGKVWRLVDTI